MQYKYQRYQKLVRSLCVFSVGFSLFLCIELFILLVFNPDHALGEGNIYSHFSLLPFLLVHGPLFSLFLLPDLGAALLLTFGITRPLALISYLRTVRKTHKEVNDKYFPLTGLQLITEDIPDQNTTDFSGRYQEQPASILDLVQQQDTHQILLGVPGAGKTTILAIYEYYIASQPWAAVFGRKQLPVFIPMNDYNLFLQEHIQAVSHPPQDIFGEGTLFHYLSERQLEGGNHLLPYLKKLMEQGRILFLCDGLNEVDNTCLPFIRMTFSQLMNQEPANRIVMTCREVDYSEQRGLKEMVKTNLVKPLLVNPLTHEQIKEFVEEYFRKINSEMRHTEEQIMDRIKFSSLQVHCKNPMMLVALIDIIESTENGEEKQLNTRGQLMHEFVLHLIRRERKKLEKNNRIHELPEEEDVLLFLSEVACAARWAGDRNAIQLPAADARIRSDRKVRYQLLANALQHWLDDHTAQVPFVVSKPVQPLHERFDQEAYARLIGFALESSLIEVKTSGKLSFKHEMVAEYFVAHYFWHMDSSEQPPLPLNERIFTDEDKGRWSEPVIIWAGLVEDPRKLAERFAAFGTKQSGYILEAVSFSLNCMGVLWTPKYVANQHATLPPIVEEALSKAIINAEARKKLADIFNGCAQKGGKEVYYSLLSSLTTQGIEDLLVLLDKSVIPDILFKYLEDIGNKEGYHQDVLCLVRVLGRFGAISIERAIQLSQNLPENSIRLRCAAINILGRTGVESAVDPLIICLHDKNSEVYNHAINALIRLKVGYSLAPVTHLLEIHTSATDELQVYLAALYIVDRFLFASQIENQVSNLQFTRTLQVLVPILSSNYPQEVQQKAKEILIALGNSAAKQDRRKETIEALIAHLSSGDGQMAHNVIQVLIKVGPVATPYLLNYLPRGEKSRRVYIIEVLEKVRDQQSLSPLLHMVADPDVQQEVAHALQVYAPESVEGLVKQVLTDEKNLIAEKSAAILKKIGAQAVLPIVDMLSPAIPDRSLLLVRVLEDIGDERAIPRLIDLLHRPEVEPLLMQTIIHALGQFEDKRVIAPLLSMLEKPDLYNEATRSLIHLDNIAVDDVIAALVVSENPITIQRLKQVLYQMEPFPEKQLIEQMRNNPEAQDQAQRIMEIFIMKNEVGAHMLAAYFKHDNAYIQNYVRQALDKMPSRFVVSALVAKLNNPVMRTDIIRYLLHREPEQVIPVLVQTLSDEDRGDAARDGLLQFEPVVIPYMIPGLNSQDTVARERARQIIVNQVHQQPEEISQVVQLLKSSLPQLALESLLDVLTNTFADISIPALQKGLETPDLIKNVAEAFKHLVQKHNEQSDRKIQALQVLREALLTPGQQEGAKDALVKIGESAIQVVGELIADTNVGRLAQDILRDIGGPALTFIWTLYNDPSQSERHDIALSIFHGMSTINIQATLIDFLRSNDPQYIAMGLGLLLERVRREATDSNADEKIMPVLFKYLHNDDPATSRIIAWLLLLNASYVASSLELELKKHPNHSEHLIHTFLFLGKEAEETLTKLLIQNTSSIDPNLKAEVAGVLGMMTTRKESRQALANYAFSLSKNGYGTKKYITNAQELAVALRALGGLLAGGRWKFTELEELLRQSLPESSQRELLDILLGKLYTPIIKERERELAVERQTRRNEKKEFEEKISKLKGELKESRGSYNNLHTLYQNLESKNGELIGISSGLQTSNESLRNQYQALSIANSALKNRIARLEVLLRMRGVNVP